MTTAPLLHRTSAGRTSWTAPRRARHTGSTDPLGEQLTDVPSVRLGLAGFALFAATAVVAAVAPPDAVGTAVLLGTAALLCLGLSPTGASVMGLAAWGFVEGFVLHDGGQLALGPGDLWLLVAAVVVCLVPVVLTSTASASATATTTDHHTGRAR